MSYTAADYYWDARGVALLYGADEGDAVMIAVYDYASETAWTQAHPTRDTRYTVATDPDLTDPDLTDPDLTDPDLAGRESSGRR